MTIYPRATVLRLYDTARKSLDPVSAVEHVAGITGLDSIAVEGVVQSRESLNSAMEQGA